MKALEIGVAVALLVLALIITVTMNSGTILGELTRQKVLMQEMDEGLKDNIEEQKRDLSRRLREARLTPGR